MAALPDHAIIAGMDSSLFDEVPALLAQAAGELIAPRFRGLHAGDIEEKAPGELVTIVDREVEARLSPALAALLRGSRVVGEEACATQPSLIAGLDAGHVWLLDPLDGTGNFIAGRPEVAILLALLKGGETIASWMLDPLDGTLRTAQRGGGAWCDGERVTAKATPGNRKLRGIVKTRFLPPGVKERVVARCAALDDQQPGTNCTAADYPAITRGESDFALYWRTLPWDHAPGVLFLQEAGGHAARLDGSPFRPHEKRAGLLAASDRETWTRTRDVLGLLD